jgi:ferritin-like metal-binding protein YciE
MTAMMASLSCGAPAWTSERAELQNAFREHRQVTEEHVRRLEQIMERYNEKPKAKSAKALKASSKKAKR